MEHQKVLYQTLADFCQFPIPSYADWRRVTEASLKGASFEQKLITKTYEQIDLQPIYRQEDIEGLPYVESWPGLSPYVRGSKAVSTPEQSWAVSQEIQAPTPEECNRLLQEALGKGQTTIHVLLDRLTRLGLPLEEVGAEEVGKEGLSIATLDDLQVAFDGLNLEEVPLFMQTGPLATPLLALISAYFEKRGLSNRHLQGCIGMDPLGTLVQEGRLPMPLTYYYDHLAEATQWSIKNCPNLQTIIVEAHPYHQGGGNAQQELAFAMATAVEYLQALLERGLSIEEAAPRISFCFSVGSQLFMEIAKLRAARVLWSTIVAAYGGSEAAQKMTIHARTSAWTKTGFDPYVNLLRGTVEAFAAVVGGANSLHVSRFDEVLSSGTDFSERLARNTQLILQEEAHLNRQIDPAGGSWYVEYLTNALTEKAWQLFQVVEGLGGHFQALQTGFVQEQIATVAAERKQNIDCRQDVFIGTTIYPNLSEEREQVAQEQNHQLMQERLQALANERKQINQEEVETLLLALATEEQNLLPRTIAIAVEGATLTELYQAFINKEAEPVTISPIKQQRGTAHFEALREASQAYSAQTGEPLQVFLSNLGSQAQYQARADFVTGFLGVGGFQVLSPESRPTVAETVQAALQSGTDIVVICGADQSYAEQVPLICQELKAQQPSVTILLAGWPAAEEREQYRAAGVDEFIHRRANCYEILRSLLRKKGVNI